MKLEWYKMQAPRSSVHASNTALNETKGISLD